MSSSPITKPRWSSARVASGRYQNQNASEVLREGLRLVEQCECEDATRFKALCSAIRVGSADIGTGCFKTFGTRKSLGAHLKSVTGEEIAKA